MRLPKSWDIAKLESPEQITFARVFDGRKVDPDTIASSDRPSGFVRVQELSVEERDVVSLRALRNYVYPIDEGLEAGQLEVLEASEVSQGDVRGQRVVFRSPEDGVTIAQIILVPPRATRFHVLVVGCKTTCYDEHEKQIEAVIDSLTVKET